MNLSLMMGSGVATNQGFEESVTQRHELGAIAVSADGRVFRYAKAGASALVRGNVLQARVAEIAHDNVACRATALGATALLITTESGDGALDANEYSGGYAVIDTDPPAGQICKIDNHLAIAASTDGTINVVAEDGLIAALTTASKITLIKNPYDGVIQQPANTPTGAAVGVCVHAITAAYFGWIQIRGVAPVLIGGTPAVGSQLVAWGDTAGEMVIDPADAADVVCGVNMIVGRDGKILPVLINFP